MTLDEVLASLFPSGHTVERGPAGTLHGTAKVEGQGEVTVVGIAGGTPLGVDGAILLAGHVLATVEAGGRAPIVVLVDTASQNMARRDELLGLNEYLAHLAKSLALAAVHGHRTVSVLFGHAAAGAFIATALPSQSLVALPGAEPSVMDICPPSRASPSFRSSSSRKWRSRPRSLRPASSRFSRPGQWPRSGQPTSHSHRVLRRSCSNPR
jgi:malonate decarboxylase gamma subunit